VLLKVMVQTGRVLGGPLVVCLPRVSVPGEVCKEKICKDLGIPPVK
jgi:hypothetical protein